MQLQWHLLQKPCDRNQNQMPKQPIRTLFLSTITCVEHLTHFFLDLAWVVTFFRILICRLDRAWKTLLNSSNRHYMCAHLAFTNQLVKVSFHAHFMMLYLMILKSVWSIHAQSILQSGVPREYPFFVTNIVKNALFWQFCWIWGYLETSVIVDKKAQQSEAWE